MARPNQQDTVEREPTALESLHAAPKKTIIVHKTGEAGELSYAFVGVNGISYQIQKGIEVEVPAPVVDNLSKALMTVFEQRTDPMTKQAYLAQREVPVYPYTVVR